MMTKRFKLSEPNGAYLIDGDKPLFHLDDSDDKIVELLNSLNKENEQLKSANKELKCSLDIERARHEETAKEVENLKQALIRCAFDER